MAKKKRHQLQIVKWRGGVSVYLNDYRIAGSKPWGGGRTVGAFVVDRDAVEFALRLGKSK